MTTKMVNTLRGIANFFKNTSKPALIWPSIYLTAFIWLIYNPLGDNLQTTSFDRQLGNALLQGIDVAKRVNSIYFYLFFLIPTTFLVIFISLSLICRRAKYKNEREAVDFLNNVAVVALIPLSIQFINKFTATTAAQLYNYAIILPCIWIITILLYLSPINFFKQLGFKVIKWGLLLAIPLYLAALVFFYKQITSVIGFNLLSVNSIIYIFCLGICYVSAILLKATPPYPSGEIEADESITTVVPSEPTNLDKLFVAAIPLALIPFGLYLFYEIANILNQYNVFINSRQYYSYGIIFVALIISLLTFFIGKPRKINFEKWYYIIIIVTLAFIIEQIPLTLNVKTDFFEQANPALSIYEFFNFGKIPVIETFDAHMMRTEISGFIYGILNQDFKGAIFSPYNGYMSVLYAILMYLLLSKVIGKNVAFLFCLLYPLDFMTRLQFYYFGFLIILLQIIAIKRSNFFTYILYWISIVATVIFSLDVGFMFIVPSLLVWVGISIIARDRIDFRKMLLSFVIIGLTAGMTFLIICWTRGINPINRAEEFIAIAMSNPMWAYSDIGNPGWLSFSLCYIFLPLAIITVSMVSIKNILFNNQSAGIAIPIILFSLVSAYIINLSRGLVRHSLHEEQITLIFSTGILFISLALDFIKRERIKSVFMFSYFGLSVFFYLLLGQNNISSQSLLDNSIQKYITYRSMNIETNQKVNRVVIDSKMVEYAEPLKGIFNLLLRPNETYIDFSSMSLLYAMTGRDKPVYVNQSPTLLSSESTQKMFIQESGNAPLLLMPFTEGFNEYDSISVLTKYYLVSEYIGQHFRPLTIVNGFAVWCRNEKYAEYVKKISESNITVHVLTAFHTDQNWENGVSIKNNALIFENTTFNQSVLKEGAILSSNNIQGQITKILLDNAWIHADIQTNNIKAFAYPNQIGVSQSFKPIDVRYDLDRGTHIYKLELIPLIWGNYDQKKASENPVLRTFKGVASLQSSETIINDLSNETLDKSTGNYVHLEFNSPANVNLTLSLISELDQKEVASFNFDGTPGRNNLIIRVSSDYMWYLEKIKSINLSTNSLITDIQFSILKGD